MAETTSEVTYSMRPWPKGWSRSGALPASLVPIIVTTLERASLKLLTASVMIAIELDMKPTVALKPTRTRFARMLMMLVLTTVCSRRFFMKIL